MPSLVQRWKNTVEKMETTLKIDYSFNTAVKRFCEMSHEIENSG